jgi:arylsulfatase A-like enzyme
VAGHDFGWMSPNYLSQAGYVDALVGRLLDEVPPSTHVLVQADHGGYERNHGTDLPENMAIPWMLAGPGVRAGHEIAAPVSLLDTAPTLARLLGLAPHPQWEGQVVEAAFS